MTEAAAAFLERSEQALDSARKLRDAGDAEGCINRAYFAAFYAASAMLAEAGETAKTHKGTHNRFWMLFVETGHLPRETADVLSYGWRMREKADYDVFNVFDISAAARLIDDVEAFTSATRELVLGFGGL